ncbi:hypothetical protein NDI44_08700 [Trichocoleus sp. DQ-A3]|uniref:hypothetical protein n=1 Tax=Cyanophyceae TaxID=3028117 RepID=UPI0016892FF8|nr:hypothetical protein [Coleofasciculus sp. FACHB-125]MBD1899270.1 hypothetical protein [Coleofasciculus sp. FACHB-125]
MEKKPQPALKKRLGLPPFIGISPRQKSLVPSGIPGLSITPDTPADPWDCDRYPNSFYCGGIPFSPEPLAVEPNVVVDPCGNVVGLELVPVVAFVQLPSVQLATYHPECFEKPKPPFDIPPKDNRPPLIDFPANVSNEAYVTVFCSFIGKRFSFERGDTHGRLLTIDYEGKWHNASCPGIVIQKYNFFTNSFYPYLTQAKGNWTYKEIYKGVNYNIYGSEPVEGSYTVDRFSLRDDTLTNIDRTVTYSNGEKSTIREHEFFINPTLNQMGGADMLSGKYGDIKRWLTQMVENWRNLSFSEIQNDGYAFDFVYSGQVRCDFILKGDCSFQPDLPVPRRHPNPPPPPKRRCCMSCCPSNNNNNDALLRLILSKVVQIDQRVTKIEKNIGTFPQQISYWDSDEDIVGRQTKTITINNLADSIPVTFDRVETVAKVIGVHEYPVKLPESLIKRDEGFLGNLIPNFPVEERNLTTLIGRFIRYFDEILGQWEVSMEVKDADPNTPGDQPKGMKFRNLSEAVAELIQLQFSNSITTETVMSVAMRTLLETAQIKQQGFKTYSICDAIADWAGFQQTEEVQKLQLLLNPNFKNFDQLFTETEVDTSVVKFKGKDNFAKSLYTLLHAAAVIRAVHTREVDPNGDIGKQITDDIKLQSKVQEEAGGKADEGQDFDAFLESAEKGFTDETGITDALNPYGRPFSQRPKLREIGDNAGKT